MTQRSRAFCWTLNNYTQDEIELISLCLPCVYCCYGKEISESGTPHLQGFVYFKSARTLSSAIRIFPNRTHVEIMQGTIEQAIVYCKKDGDFCERGVKPKSPKEKGDLEKFRWKLILSKAKNGDWDWIEENEPKLWLERKPMLISHLDLKGEIMNYTHTPHEWWVGPTGTGKSRKAHADYPDHFQKKLNKWWDGYTGQDVVVIEEWSPKNELTGSSLKIWADRYPFPAEIKGGTLQRLRPQKIIVLSNYTIEQCFSNSEESEPLLRRFKVTVFKPELTVDNT